MKTAVWKFAIPLEDAFTLSMPADAEPFTLSMPADAEPLTVQMQNGAPWLWARVDPEAPRSERRFFLCGTGHNRDDLAPADAKYVGSFQMQGGALVFHVFVQI